MANQLIHEKSPYLLQHAHNPVNWMPWNDDTLALANKENKLILISIGYSACHWCHVMEKECFENEDVAKIMNLHFINMKVDREERPDIDQVYMSAVQLMTGAGGWPLNCIALPNGKPIYGGTYFPKEKWSALLNQLATLWINDPDKTYDYANQLTQGIRQLDIPISKTSTELKADLLVKCIENWMLRLDYEEGGANRSPKFPLPNNYLFLLRYAVTTNNDKLLNQVHLTLTKMAYGGIYDQIGGGFARYSVDAIWKVPHFEKMLYDNAQLILLYTEAYKQSKNELYKTVVEETIAFCERELYNEQGYFYAALDADSEGVEGKYYVWQVEELEALIGKDFKLFSEYYNINNLGYWEHDNYILLRDKDDAIICAEQGITISDLNIKINQWKEILLKNRETRIRPGLDDKFILSWNALMIEALSEAGIVLDAKYLKQAEKLNTFIKSNLFEKDTLKRCFKEGKAYIDAFLDDYSFYVKSLISLYSNTGKEEYYQDAKDFLAKIEHDFLDTESGLYFYSNKHTSKLIASKFELADNVTPASNSIMANVLWKMATLNGDLQQIDKVKQMCYKISTELENYGAGYSEWAQVIMNFSVPHHEISFVGKNVDEIFREAKNHYLPNCTFVISRNDSSIAMVAHKFSETQNNIFICKDQACHAPVQNIASMLAVLG